MSLFTLSSPILHYTHVWESCIIASIAHAIMIPKYPELSYEHGWNGSNYLIQNSQGSYATVTFERQRVVAAFRNEKIALRSMDVESFFKDAPLEIQQIAYQETFQFLLDEREGELSPAISAACWIEEGTLYSSDTKEDLLRYGAQLLFDLLLSREEAYKYWREALDMTDSQYALLCDLSERKIAHPHDQIVLTPVEIEIIQVTDEQSHSEMELCAHSLHKIGIYLA